MIGISVIGSGRMGQVYARNIHDNPATRLVHIVNPNLPSAAKLADEYGATAVGDIHESLADPAVDAVIISTPTNTHLEMIEAAAQAGKPILCEKPLDLDLSRVDRCIDILKQANPVFLLGFNRRFDPGVTALREAVRAGEVGDLHMLMLTSRDPGPPPVSYVKSSGGYFADSTIHDIDLACWISGERPTEVFATGSCLVDPEIGAAGDLDTTMTVLKMPSGCLVHVNNSRKSVYGFDQRIEAFGSGGMVQTKNQHDDNLLRSSGTQTMARAPLKHFFLERYAASFERMVQEFVDAIQGSTPASVSAADGRAALAIALACEKSRREGRAVKPDY